MSRCSRKKLKDKSDRKEEETRCLLTLLRFFFPKFSTSSSRGQEKIGRNFRVTALRTRKISTFRDEFVKDAIMASFVSLFDGDNFRNFAHHTGIKKKVRTKRKRRKMASPKGHKGISPQTHDSTYRFFVLWINSRRAKTTTDLNTERRRRRARFRGGKKVVQKSLKKR